MGAQDDDRLRVQGDRAAAGFRLQRARPQLPVGTLLELPGDVGDSLVQVQVIPRQPARLAAPQPAHRHEVIRGEHRVTRDRGQELRQLRRRPHRHHGPLPGTQPFPDPPLGPHHRERPTALRQLQVPGRIIADQPLPHGRVEGGPQRREQPPRRRRGHPVIEQPLEGVLHVADVQLAQQHPVEQPAEVQPDVALVHAPRAVPQPRPRLDPRLQPLHHRVDAIARVTEDGDAEPVPRGGSRLGCEVAAPAKPPPSAIHVPGQLTAEVPASVPGPFPAAGTTLPAARRACPGSRTARTPNLNPARPTRHILPAGNNRRDIIEYRTARDDPNQ